MEFRQMGQIRKSAEKDRLNFRKSNLILHWKQSQSWKDFTLFRKRKVAYLRKISLASLALLSFASSQKAKHKDCLIKR